MCKLHFNICLPPSVLYCPFRCLYLSKIREMSLSLKALSQSLTFAVTGTSAWNGQPRYGVNSWLGSPLHPVTRSRCFFFPRGLLCQTHLWIGAVFIFRNDKIVPSMTKNIWKNHLCLVLLENVSSEWFLSQFCCGFNRAILILQLWSVRFFQVLTC